MELKAVRIIHDVVSGIDFFFLAEFFRLSGIYVVEQMEGEAYQGDKSCFDVTINTCGSCDGVEIEGDDCIQFSLLKGAISPKANIRAWTLKNQKKVLKQLIKEIERRLYGQVSLKRGSWWDLLIDTYVNQELVLHSMNLQFYFKKPSFAVEQARNAFYEAYNAFEAGGKKIFSSDSERKYFVYARIYCKVKVNAGCYFMGDEFQFPVEALGDECIQYISQYPGFSNLKVLLGLCYEYSREYARVAIQAFDRALESENIYCYASHIYYWIGKRYEIIDEDPRDTIQNYRWSYDKKPKYKNIYKLAIERRNSGEYEEAIQYFQMILEKLDRKLKQRRADPLEMEYYFKAYAMITIIYFYDLKNYLTAIEYGEDLIRTCRVLVDEDEFYDAFYMDNANQYRNLTKARFDLKKIRSALYYSYEYLGLKDKAEQYKNMKD